MLVLLSIVMRLVTMSRVGGYDLVLPGAGGAQGVLSYVILRPLMTAVGVIAQLLGVFGAGQLRFDRVYLYTTLVSNGSQARAHAEPWSLQSACLSSSPC